MVLGYDVGRTKSVSILDMDGKQAIHTAIIIDVRQLNIDLGGAFLPDLVAFYLDVCSAGPIRRIQFGQSIVET